MNIKTPLRGQACCESMRIINVEAVRPEISMELVENGLPLPPMRHFVVCGACGAQHEITAFDKDSRTIYITGDSWMNPRCKEVKLNKEHIVLTSFNAG